jgi:hypothetical protein
VLAELQALPVSCLAAVDSDLGMPKTRDFANERRTEGRRVGKRVRELADSLTPLAAQQGIDLQALLAEANTKWTEQRQRLAERLQESVAPLFIGDEQGRPDRIGSCILVRLDSDFFAFTAAHVLRDAEFSELWIPAEGKGGTLSLLPWSRAGTSPPGANDLDVGVLVLRATALDAFQQRIFLTGAEIDEEDQPDDHGFTSFYFVLGYSASRTQVRVSCATGSIEQTSFHCATGTVEPAEYVQQNIPQSDRVLLDFDHKEVSIGGQHPPKLQGVSGGGIFRISRDTMHGPLVAIATQNRQRSRLLIGTRLKHFLAVARELKATSPSEMFR